jgi:putative endonuclease
MRGYFYIITNKIKTVLYIGVTSDLKQRIDQHRNGLGSVFAARYNLVYLVYFEEYQHISDAIAREKQLKHWNRSWKFDLIAQLNPKWLDLLTEEVF